MERLPLSVTLISLNEEDNIGRTLESIKDIAFEIVVVDSHSTDKTREIAKRYGAEVYEEDWKGHIDQKNSALEKCTQEYILSIDCDEVVSTDLKDSIISAVKNREADGFYVNRKTSYLGKFLEHTWQPEWRLRLIRRSSNPKWGGYDPHDSLYIVGKTKKLKGDLYHYSYKDVEDHYKRALTYSKLVSGAYRKMGKRFRVYNLIFNPAIAFMKNYFFKMGFLDGIRGLSVSVSEAFSTFLKYLYLWEIKNAEDLARKK
jgi:glycosyltransferase involved in cell wall biosynthesis